MTNTADISSKIEQFLSLSQTLKLTLPEEETLVSLEPAEWARWRSLAVPETAMAPSLLVRRLDYAITLLQRMAASAPSMAHRVSSGESRR